MCVTEFARQVAILDFTQRPPTSFPAQSHRGPIRGARDERKCRLWASWAHRQFSQKLAALEDVGLRSNVYVIAVSDIYTHACVYVCEHPCCAWTFLDVVCDATCIILSRRWSRVECCNTSSGGSSSRSTLVATVLVVEVAVVVVVTAL